MTTRPQDEVRVRLTVRRKEVASVRRQGLAWDDDDGQILYWTRQLSYRREDRAMRPIYGCPENFPESSLGTRLLFPKFVMGFCYDRY